MYQTTTLVLNWHLTEACNYGCKYCYAAWNESSCQRELIHDAQRVQRLLSELYQFFQPGNCSNPLARRFSWRSVRLNLAGGEPLLYADKLQEVVRKARNLGFEVSMISNGSNLTAELMHKLAPQLTWLGISIDSACPTTNGAIGRLDRHGRMLDLASMVSILGKARQFNPDLRLKLNTVVNKLNQREDFHRLIQRFDPDKWKVLRMLPVVNQSLAVSNQQFSEFVVRHQALASILCAEDDKDMRESYLMIDPQGRFFQNIPLIEGQGYVYSKPIIEVGAEAAFSEIAFDFERFSARYAQVG